MLDHDVSKMRRVFQVTVVLFAAIVSAQDRPTLRIDVREVHVDVEVLSKDGRIITGLTQSDFRVLDEGQEQTLVGFTSEQQPLDIILLFDISSSMRSKLGKLTTAARQSLQELREGDRVSVMTFGDQTDLVSGFTNDLDAVERDIQGILSQRLRGANTYLQQAVDDAGNYFRQHPRSQRRRVILVITDNLGNRTRSEMSVVQNLWEADVVLCGLTIRDPGYPVRRAIVAVVAPYVLGRVRGMDRIAEQTGGDTIRLDDPGSAFPEIMRRIRCRYSLYYPTPEGRPGSFRKIRVELARGTQARFPEARVHARRGYKLTPQR
jgi:VWFA-related protein